MSKTFPKRVIAMPTEAENRKILRAAEADPDAQPLADEQLKAMMAPIKAVRGRPKSENKKQSARRTKRAVQTLYSGLTLTCKLGGGLSRRIHAMPALDIGGLRRCQEPEQRACRLHLGGHRRQPG